MWWKRASVFPVLFSLVFSLPYIDPLTLTTISPSQSSDVAAAISSWTSTFALSQASDPAYSSFDIAFETLASNEDPATGVVFSAGKFLMTFHPSLGADVQFRSIISAVPSNMQSYLLNIADQENAAIASALNPQTAAATSSAAAASGFLTKKFASEVSLPSSTPSPSSTSQIHLSPFPTSTSSAPTSDEQSSSDNGSLIGFSVGLVFAVLVIISGIAAYFCFNVRGSLQRCFRRRKSKKSGAADEKLTGIFPGKNGDQYQKPELDAVEPAMSGALEMPGDSAGTREVIYHELPEASSHGGSPVERMEICDRWR